MGEIRYQKRASGTWRYSFDGARINGKRSFISKGGFRTKKEAIAAGTKAYNEYNRAGTVFNPVDISFADYLDLWMDVYVRINCKTVTADNYAKKIRLHIKPALGKYRLSALNPKAIQTLIDTKFNEGYSRNTLSVIKGILTGALSYAVQPLEYIQTSPVAYVRLPSTRAEAKVKTRSAPHVVISKEDMMRILERFPEGTCSHIPLMIGYKCGMRLSEVFGLTWDCVDLENLEITINKQIQWRDRDRNTGKSGYWYFSPPKYNSVRTIKIPQDLADLLRREKDRQEQAVEQYEELYTYNYIDEHNVLNSEGHGEKIDLVMIRLDGSYIVSRNTKYVSRVARKELGIEKFDFHSLRHTHATMLAELGASPKYVQHRLGHKNIQVTMQIYQHLTKKMEDKDSALLDEL